MRGGPSLYKIDNSVTSLTLSVTPGLREICTTIILTPCFNQCLWNQKNNNELPEIQDFHWSIFILYSPLKNMLINIIIFLSIKKTIITLSQSMTYFLICIVFWDVFFWFTDNWKRVLKGYWWFKQFTNAIFYIECQIWISML